MLQKKVSPKVSGGDVPLELDFTKDVPKTYNNVSKTDKNITKPSFALY
jgi:hypothetical protein